MLVDSVVDHTAPRNLDKALVLVVEAELVRPILLRAVGERSASVIDETRPFPPFIIGVRADNGRTLAALAPRPER